MLQVGAKTLESERSPDCSLQDTGGIRAPHRELLGISRDFGRNRINNRLVLEEQYGSVTSPERGQFGLVSGLRLALQSLQGGFGDQIPQFRVRGAGDKDSTARSGRNTGFSVARC